MMKWGGRKPSSSSSRPSHASPFSWLSKFKQMRINSEPNPAKMKHKEKHISPKYSCGNGDDGAFWRQSFVEGIQEDMKLKSKDIDEHVIPSSSCHGGGRNAKKDRQRESTPKLKEKDKLLNDRKVSREMEEFNREKEYENLRRRFERKAQQVLQEQLLKLEREVEEEVEFASSKAVEKDVLLQLESPRTICTPRTHSFASSSDSKNSSLRNIIEDRVFSTKRIEKTTDDRLSQKKLSSEQKQNLEQIKELKVRTNKQRQPLHVSREIQRRKPKHSPCRVRIYSPRMVSKVETCKIKALEDMRKAKLKMKKEREEIVEETPDLDSFAVIKCSLDPKQDFRDSMIEMIIEKQIRQPEEMEELLACYLTLNADEYHDLIIKVFRKVWFDMSQYGLGIKSDMQWCYYE